MASRTAPILFALLLASAAEAKTPHRAGCDRACLTALADRYVDALAAVVEMPFSVRPQSGSKGANTVPSFSSTVLK